MTFNKIKSNQTGTFHKQDNVLFDPSLWAATNGTINWSEYQNQMPYNETDVYHTELVHTAVESDSTDISWKARIGKGGQIYYIDVEGIGQIVCPQRSFSAWNDDCMTTTVHSKNEANKDLEMGGNDSYANGYIHGSGMYIKPYMDALNYKPFYCPLLAEQFNPSDRSYSVINWGLVPKPNINRGDVLFYSRYRDMGNGVLELTFYCYNFGNRTYTFAETPWFAFRSSKFPNMIEGVQGTSKFKTNNKMFKDGAIPSSGGWGAGTVNPEDSQSLTCALVWGNQTKGVSVNFGFVDKGERDMMLIAPSYSLLNMPYGTGFCYRRYLVFGKLNNVAHLCSKLNQHCFIETIEFENNLTNKLPLYSSTRENQSILTTTQTGYPIGYVSATPLKNSVPLFLMKNKLTGKYFVSADPYACCEKTSFSNPYPINHSKYNSYQNKVIYKPYDGSTEWIELLGFGLTDNTVSVNLRPLSQVLNGTSFIQGEKQNSSQILIF
jgi:hypothetical protein